MKKRDKFWLMPLFLLLYVVLTPYVYGLSLLQLLKNMQSYIRNTCLNIKVISFADLFKQVSHAYHKTNI